MAGQKPVARISPKRLLTSAILTLGWMFLMGSLVKPLTSASIVQFELAGNVEKAGALLAGWQAQDLIGLFRRSVYLDFVFLVLYCWSLSLACRFVALRLGDGALSRVAVFFARMIWLAGLCDAIENTAMIVAVSGGVSPATAQAAFWFAAAKFLGVAVILFFLVFSMGYLWLKKLKPEF